MPSCLQRLVDKLLQVEWGSLKDNEAEFVYYKPMPVPNFALQTVEQLVATGRCETCGGVIHTYPDWKPSGIWAELAGDSTLEKEHGFIQQKA